jgi:ribosomal protein S18 acetylase RimI-like enzyme
VLPEYRRQGIGRILMQAVESITHESELAWVRLEVRTAQPENQAFYLKLGYELGTVSRYLPDGHPRSHWMSKRLH